MIKRAGRNHFDMCNGPMASSILRFAIPFIIASIMNPMFNAADIVVVGKFAGDTSQAAVTSTTSLINLFINLFMGLSVGVNVVVARALGGGEKNRVGAVVHTSITVGLLGGCGLAVAGELLAPTLLRLMGSPEHIELALSRRENRAVVTVSDRGCGIPLQTLQDIRQGKQLPLGQGGDTSRGMGIGLSACQSIITAHGGSFHANNRPEGGAIFCFELPLETEDKNHVG